MQRADAIHRAIQDIYEASLAPENWSRAIASVAKASCAHKSMLHASSWCGSKLAVSSGFGTEDLLRLQREIEHRLPAWIEAIPTGTALRQTSAISDADFRKTDLYNIAVKPAGGFYGIVAPLVRGPNHRILLTVARNAGAADFSPDDLRATELLSSHLVTALKVWQRLADAQGLASAAYETVARLNIGIVFLDGKMRPMFTNPCADALASSRDGLTIEAHRLSATRPDDAKRLAEAIASATAMATATQLNDCAGHARASTCLIHRDAPRGPLVARVIPVLARCRSPLDIATARTIVFIMAPDKPPVIDAALLSSAFGLTPRETMLAVRLVHGADLREAARQMNVGTGTARSYLKRILSKTDTHRQAELVSLLLRTSLQCVTEPLAGARNGVYDEHR